MSMGYQYQRSPTITAGQYVTAETHVSMSNAFNDRLKAGLGDCTRRIHQYINSVARQVRNPSEPDFLGLATTWPARDEWAEFYAYLGKASGSWPGIEAGEYEGPNLANPMMAFIFGNPQIYGEGERLYEAMPNPGFLGDSVSTIWELTKYQRGGYDITNGNQNVPMFEASQTHMMISQPGWSFHNKSYGGYIPQPKALGYCTVDNGIWWINEEHKFTCIDESGCDGGYAYNATKTYTGTCGPSAVHQETGVEGTLDEVAGIWDMPFAYFVQKFDGSVDRFDKKQWLYGPLNGGGYLGRPNADGIQRLLLNPFLKEFRGTNEQRSGSCFDLMAVAFDFQHFYNSQYQLAPAYATTDGEELSITYPSQNFIGSVAEGTTTTAYNIHSGYRYGGHIIRQNNLPHSIYIQRFENGVETGKYLIEPTTSSYVDIHPSGSQTNVQFRFSSSVNLNVGAYVNIEWSELYDYKPEIWDAYAYIRMCATNGLGDEGDDYPYEIDQSATISNLYKAYGAVINLNSVSGVGQQFDTVNSNPVYESFRRQAHEWTRVLNRKQLHSYEVIEHESKQKSVLWLKRYIYNLDEDLNMDAFDGLLEITASAPSASFSNEWVMDMSFNLYGNNLLETNNNSSEWKPEAYGDYFGMTQRCHILNPNISANRNPDMFKHFQEVRGDNIHELYRSRLFAPEALSAYTYAQQSNLPYRYWEESQKIGFYKSCQIYPDPYYVESCSVHNEAGVDLVRVQFNQRFQTVDEMTGSIVPRDKTNWESTFGLIAQPYRTEENALMEYLIAAAGGVQASTKIGDCAANKVDLGTETGNPHGAVLPRFFFTKLITKPFFEKLSNYTLSQPDLMVSESLLDPSKTTITCDRFIQMETYLRAICEGYVNSDKAPDCNDPSLGIYSTAWDYTWEDLWFSVDHGKWWTTFPEALRSDEPIGYGPLPTTNVYAEALNRLSSAVNKLNRVRVPLPYKLLCQQKYYSGQSTTSNTWCGPHGCAKGGRFDYSPPGASSLDLTTDWEECDGMSSYVQSEPVPLQCDLDKIKVQTTRLTTNFKFEPADPLAYYAMNENLRALYNQENNGFFARIQYDEDSIDATITDIYTDAESCELTYQGQIGHNHHFWCSISNTGVIFTPSPSNVHTVACGILNDGVVDVGSAPPPGDYFWGITTTDCGHGSSIVKTISPVDKQENIVLIPFK